MIIERHLKGVRKGSAVEGAEIGQVGQKENAHKKSSVITCRLRGMKPIHVYIFLSFHMLTSDSSGDSTFGSWLTWFPDVPLALRPTVSDGLP